MFESQTGEPVWELNLREEFEPTDKPKWGACSTPLLVSGMLIVNPGAKDASLVALDPKTGKTRWKTPGKPAGYGSLIAGTFGGKHQIIGHDASTLRGWDIATGERLWSLTPPVGNDFNVPTPMAYDGQLIITTENNGTRLYGFHTNGTIQPQPLAVNKRLNPDTHSPVVVGSRLFGIWRSLQCLDLKNGLKPIWTSADQAFSKYAAIVANDKLGLAITLEGMLILFDTTADEYNERGRLHVLPEEKGLYAHPAFVGTQVIIRSSRTVDCYDFG